MPPIDPEDEEEDEFDPAAFSEEEEDDDDDSQTEDDGEEEVPNGGKDEVSSSSNNGVSSSGNDSDGVWCSICYENWSSQGPHQVCCLPCGHVYGFSCIQKWIRHYKRNSRECPQCKRVCKLKDIIKLYVPRLAVVDGEQEKKLLSLQSEIEFLKLKIASLQEKVSQNNEEKICMEEVNGLYNVPEETRRRDSEFLSTAGDLQGQILSGYGGQGSSFCNFELEDEFQVVGARIFDIDASSRVLLLARRLPGSCGDHVLTKISLVYPYDSENIQLPPSTKAVKDVHISPCAERLALFASLGKKLSILSMASNNIVVTYNLPVPAWSCSWDLNSQHHVYAGLQNGTLLVFDIRQTAGPLESINGLSSHPLHTIQSLVHNSSTPNVRTLLSASSIGPCVWKPGIVGERPFLVPETENQDNVCVSLAYSPLSEDIIASYRPKVQTTNEIGFTQATQAVPGRGVLGTHVHLRRVGSNVYQKQRSCVANVSDVRMLKSAIVNVDNRSLFACGDEATRGLSIYELPSLRVMQTLEPHTTPILDVKFAATLGANGILGCTSDDKLQLFSAKFS